MSFPVASRARLHPLQWILLSALFLGSACASQHRVDTGPDPALVRSLAQSAANQVRRCYRRPAVTSEARQIITRLRVRFTPDGQLAQLPEVVWQSSVIPATEQYAARMAEAATSAVLRCAPIRLPPEAYSGGWDELEFTFSPLARS